MNESHDWLRERADDLLARDSAGDSNEYWSAYDNLLWAVVTASRNELGALVRLLYGIPYIGLPVPIQVTVFRLWGLEQPLDPERARVAAAHIAQYCSPGEESNATSGLLDIGRAVG